MSTTTSVIWCPTCQLHHAAPGGKPCPVCVGRGRHIAEPAPVLVDLAVARVPVPPPSRRWWKR